MHVYSPPPSRSKRRLVWETWIDRRTVVVTYAEAGEYVTEVMGGPMDGMDCDTKVLRSALNNHNGMVSLARSCSGERR